MHVVLPNDVIGRHSDNRIELLRPTEIFTMKIEELTALTEAFRPIGPSKASGIYIYLSRSSGPLTLTSRLSLNLSIHCRAFLIGDGLSLLTAHPNQHKTCHVGFVTSSRRAARSKAF